MGIKNVLLLQRISDANLRIIELSKENSLLRKQLAESKTALVIEERKERCHSLELLPTFANDLELHLSEQVAPAKDGSEDQITIDDKFSQLIIPLNPKDIRKKVRNFESALIAHRKPSYDKLRKNLVDLSQKKLPTLADVCS